MQDYKRLAEDIKHIFCEVIGKNIPASFTDKEVF